MMPTNSSLKHKEKKGNKSKKSVKKTLEENAYRSLSRLVEETGIPFYSFTNAVYDAPTQALIEGVELDSQPVTSGFKFMDNHVPKGYAVIEMGDVSISEFPKLLEVTGGEILSEILDASPSLNSEPAIIKKDLLRKVIEDAPYLVVECEDYFNCQGTVRKILKARTINNNGEGKDSCVKMEPRETSIYDEEENYEVFFKYIRPRKHRRKRNKKEYFEDGVPYSTLVVVDPADAGLKGYPKKANLLLPAEYLFEHVEESGEKWLELAVKQGEKLRPMLKQKIKQLFDEYVYFDDLEEWAETEKERKEIAEVKKAVENMDLDTVDKIACTIMRLPTNKSSPQTKKAEKIVHFYEENINTLLEDIKETLKPKKTNNFKDNNMYENSFLPRKWLDSKTYIIAKKGKELSDPLLKIGIYLIETDACKK